MSEWLQAILPTRSHPRSRTAWATRPHVRVLYGYVIRGRVAHPTRVAPQACSTLDECAAPVGERTERLVGRDRGDQLEIIPLALGFRRLLGLVEVNRMNLAAIGADRAFTKQRIAGRHFFHFRHHGFAVAAVANGRYGLQVMRGRRVDAGLHVVRHDLARMLVLEALGKGAA